MERKKYDSIKDLPRKKCLTCGKAFNPTRINQLYCNVDCTPNSYNKKKKVNANCLMCNKSFVKKYPHHVFCSTECNKNSRKGLLSNKDLKEFILEKHEFMCKECGKKPKLAYSLHIHHIIPLFKGGKNEVGNLEALCFDCHLKKHKLWKI